MFNNFLFNNGLFNEIETVGSPDTTQDEVSYNWFWLFNQNIIITKINYDNSHTVESDIFNSPLSDLWWELSYYFRQKNIVLNWYLKYDTAEELNNAIDTLKKALWENNKNLDIKVNWTIRRAKASCINLNFDREGYHITFVPFTIEFRLIKEFLHELTNETISLLWLATWFTEEIVNGWTVRTNPIFNIVINSWTPTSISLNIWDDTLIINRIFTAWEVLEINCIDKRVKINGSNIDFIWTFPILKVWVNSLSFSITWSIDFDFTVIYNKNYL